MLNKQTIKSIEVIENWNMPEVISMNTGLKKARGKFAVLLEQDCVPEDKYWLERLIEPLKDKNIVATVSQLGITHEYWSNYPFDTENEVKYALLKLLEVKDKQYEVEIKQIFDYMEGHYIITTKERENIEKHLGARK